MTVLNQCNFIISLSFVLYYIKQYLLKMKYMFVILIKSLIFFFTHSSKMLSGKCNIYIFIIHVYITYNRGVIVSMGMYELLIVEKDESAVQI